MRSDAVSHARELGTISGSRRMLRRSPGGSNVLRRHVLLALSLAACGLTMAAPARAGDTPMAPDFSVRLLDNRGFRMLDMRGHPVVLDFWATWCVPCRAGMPDLDVAQKKYARQGLVVLGLSVDEDGPDVVRPFVQQLRLTYRMAMADDRILDRYGPIRSIPTVFFINRQGEVVRRVTGYIDPETLDAYLRELF
jgi:cytochrome c biogenesis protein CcmG/thiol:disulfide interchange protein DsbE